MIFIFGAVIFTNAFLLFWVEPLVAKILLPYYGGSAGVWNTCVAFFQTVLVAGYAYVHFGSQRPRVFWVFHVGLLISAVGASFLWFDTAVSESTSLPNLSLLLTLCTMIGLSFFAIASHGPLLQKWLPTRYHNPYILFAASNAGSLLGLISFPFFLEAWAPSQSQIWWWNISFLMVASAVVGLGLFSKPWQMEPASNKLSGSGGGWGERAKWLALSAVPSALMLSVTSFVSNEIAAAPLLWAVPLALYLLTFIIVFSPFSAGGIWFDRLRETFQSLPRTTRIVFCVVALAATGGAVFFTRESVASLILFHFGLFFVVTLNLHGQLAALKPETNRLTEFYLWLGLGGALGGMVIAFVAPLLFTRVHEYPLTLATAIICWGQLRKIKISLLDIALPLLVGAIGFAAAAMINQASWSPEFDLRILLFLGGLVVLVKGVNRVRIGLTILLMIWVSTFFPTRLGWWLVEAERSFYGAHKVYHDREGGIYWLQHGDTIHGAQMESADFPLTYYSPMGPLGDVFREFRKQQQEQEQSIGVIGLGVGTMLYYAKPGDKWTVYELDQAVVEIAEEKRYFRYLDDTVADLDVIVGDGRLQIAKEPTDKFSLLIVDAFGSDSVPTHLLTQEALAIYLDKLKPGGQLIFHASSRFFDLSPVVATVSHQFGHNTFVRQHTPGPQLSAVYKSRWLVVTKADELTFKEKRWNKVEPRSEEFLWTDQFSSILSVL